MRIPIHMRNPSWIHNETCLADRLLTDLHADTACEESASGRL